MPVRKSEFGRDPQTHNVVHAYELSDGPLSAKVLTYGARLAELHAPDRAGKSANVVCGFDNLGAYLGKNPHFGSTVGRVANRIKGATFDLDGTTYKLTANEHGNTLHSGASDFDRVLWSAEIVPTRGDEGAAISLVYVSPDGEGGFPGNLTTRLRISLAGGRDLRLVYEAATDAPTIVNLTNHSYFNLAGPGTGSTIHDHEATIHASHYLPTGAGQLPTGAVAKLAGTPLDLSTPTRLGDRMKQIDGGGYDHCYVLDQPSLDRAAVRVRDPKTGRVLEVLTDQPGAQLYAGVKLDGTVSGLGGRYDQYGAFCLETQIHPDAVHHANFPSIVLRPGQTYRHTCVYRLTAE
jgi:aldose 1-epimerase